MRVEQGNLWEFTVPPWNALVVVPTNIGWRGDGSNVMGRGLAKEAKLRYAGIAEWYGGVCRSFREDTPVVRYFRSSAILAPSKRLARDPSRSWESKSDLGIVARSVRQISRWHEMTSWGGLIAVPLLGCGNGELEEAEVWPIFRAYLLDERLIVVRKA